MSTVHIISELSVCDRLPIQLQLAAPPPAPGIHLVLRGLPLGVYSKVNWVGPRRKRVPDRERDQGYVQSRLEVQMGRHQTHRLWHRAETHLHVDNDAMTDRVRWQTRRNERGCT